ncbi:MAG TPA: anaerobic ribonucleoside-triphosphate reductase, partial [Chromatiaceae bacterium]|nr:anaerobic ribonucleoside-triphosphate reductase [Chromatiaceae bacterium]
RDSLEVKRKVIQRLIDQGLFPYTKRYLGTLRNHFSTIGVNGLNEMIRNFSADRENITTPTGQAQALRCLDHLRRRLVAIQEETGHLYNLEATPAEGATYRFAREDQKRFPAILQAGTPAAPYYTNSSQLPVGFTDDPFQALELQEQLQARYTGGTVLHLYMSEQISSTEACKRLVRRALTRFRLPYLTITPRFSICPRHGYLPGEHEFCPRCDQELLARRHGQPPAEEPVKVQAKAPVPPQMQVQVRPHVRDPGHTKAPASFLTTASAPVPTQTAAPTPAPALVLTSAPVPAPASAPAYAKVEIKSRERVA